MATVNFGHKKNPAEAGSLRWLSVSSYVLAEGFVQKTHLKVGPIY